MNAAGQSAPPSIVVLGDMRDLHHHGCEAVMAQVHAGLGEVGLRPTSLFPGLDWKHGGDTCREAALVVINGEGALHDSRPVVAGIIELAEIRRREGRPTALINASWFRNDDSLTQRLVAFNLIALRDPQSRAAVAAQGVACLAVPDLAVSQARAWQAQHSSPPPRDFMVSDSTQPEVTRHLVRFARKRAWRYLPALARPVEHRPGAKSRRIHRRYRWASRLGPFARWALSPRYHAHLVGVATTDEYCEALAAARGVVTGRFHTVCFALGLEVPLLAVASNTPKIESLLADAGLDPRRRMVHATELECIEEVPPYETSELAALRRFLETAARARQELFGALKQLVVNYP